MATAGRLRDFESDDGKTDPTNQKMKLGSNLFFTISHHASRITHHRITYQNHWHQEHKIDNDD
jgi:hypothetical protein